MSPSRFNFHTLVFIAINDKHIKRQSLLVQVVCQHVWKLGGGLSMLDIIWVSSGKVFIAIKTETGLEIKVLWD